MQKSYMMEHNDECNRLDLKTSADDVVRQAAWAGIGEGMRVLDAGCGVGKTTSILKDLVGDTGSVTGLDASRSRLDEGQKRYGREGIRFVQHDLTTPFLPGEQYDAVWMRFLLEYFRDDPLAVVRNATACLKPGGILCLVDLDHNSLNHYGLSERLYRTILQVLQKLEQNRNFDPYAGRKLYAHLFDLGYLDIDLKLESHHLIYGQLNEKDAYNWTSKIDVAAKNSGCDFAEYGGDYDAVREEFFRYLCDPRRFIYTPLILCRGIKPENVSQL